MTIRKILFLLFLIIASPTVYSQSTECNCSNNLDTLILKTEKNYAGFPIKVNNQNLKAYQILKKDLKESANTIREAKPCFHILSKYVKFFYDSHFNIRYYNPEDFDQEIVHLNEAELRKKISVKKKHELEGIWVNQDSSLKVGILQYPHQTFKAIVLETKNAKIPQGLVYMTISQGRRGWIVKYYNSFSSTNFPIQLKGNLLQGWSEEIFGKIFPTQMNEIELKELNTWKNNNNGLNFYKISPKTAVLRIPTFANNDDKIMQLIQQNDSIIRSTENLIVDLSGNGGGSTGWVSFLGYFMTKPIVQQNGFLRISSENVKLKLADIEPYVTQPIPSGYEKYFPEATLNLYKKAYQDLPSTQEIFYPVPGVTFPLDSITKYPKKIALVVDNLCGSSAEYFFYLSKESSKTTSYGINTFGMMDYEGASSTILPYTNFSVSIPIVKSSWTDTKPIDKTGFKPTVSLVKIRQADWIKHIQQNMEK
jgi:hypothetical protein